MPVHYLTPAIEDRAVEVQLLLARPDNTGRQRLNLPYRRRRRTRRLHGPARRQGFRADCGNDRPTPRTADHEGGRSGTTDCMTPEDPAQCRRHAHARLFHLGQRAEGRSWSRAAPERRFRVVLLVKGVAKLPIDQLVETVSALSDFVIRQASFAPEQGPSHSCPGAARVLIWNSMISSG